MCPNCDNFIKLDSESESFYCAHCGIQLDSRDAFVYYDLKTGGEPDMDGIDSFKLLMRCSAGYLEQKKYEQADSCYEKILKLAPDDYRIWKLRALAWESRVINEYHKSFYEFRKENGVVENKEYLAKFRELCGNAVRHCPGDMAGELAEEFNERVRGHFDIAYRAYKLEKRRTTAYTLLAGATLFALAAMALNACRIM